ncbi:MAG TPA: hypothetical protein VMT12_01665 [Syntrophales bacterium]|nr:hypothetical protein [Syntrophales bacterium]
MKINKVKLEKKQECSKRYPLAEGKEDYLESEYNRQLERLNNRFSWPAWIEKN